MTENSMVEGDKLYVICQNLKENLDLLVTFNSKSVRHLVFINCKLKHIPNFEHVERLALINCAVHSFEHIRQFQDLKVLTVSNVEGLSELAISMRECHNLVYLNVSNNSLLARLPSWILSLPLVHLSVHENSLTEIPELLPKSLRVLFIHNNQIEKLSPFLGQLPNLSFVSLHCNPLVFPELSIAKSKTKDLLLYLRAFLTDTVPNNTIKVSFVGQERAGKSTLLEAIKSSNGMCDDSTSVSKTDGLEISSFALNDIQLRAFDLAGDIDFIETHTMFVSEGTLFLAVFDLRSYTLNSFSTYFFGRLEIWLSSIYAQAPNSRVLLVGTHADGEMITPSLLESVWQKIRGILNHAREKHLQDFKNSQLQSCLLCHPDTLERTTIDGVAGCVTLDIPCDIELNNSLSTENEDYKNDRALNENNDDTEEAIDRRFQNSSESSSNSIGKPESDGESSMSEQEDDTLRFPHIVGYYEVSTLKQIPRKAFSNKNVSVDQLKDGIQKCASEMLAQNPNIPRKWFKLHEILVKKVEKKYPILSYQQFTDIARECGFDVDANAEQELDPFLRHFHSCGELLYYFDIDELCDIIIIDPQWLSNQLRSVISYRKSHLVDDGVIRHDQLKSLWKDLGDFYQHKLISLLRQAGVFIKFSDDADLIPCRLPVGKPSDDMWPLHSNENQVDFLFQFVNLPPSFFSHVIAMVENKHEDFGGKMQPLYYSNHIVYITRSPGTPCEIHTRKEQTADDVVDGGADQSNATGVSLARLLSFNVKAAENLMDAGRVSFRFSTLLPSDDTDFICIPHDHQAQIPRHRIHIELFPHTKTIILSIRGPTPCCVAPETIDILNRIRLTRYNAISMDFYVLCPYCVRKSVRSPAKFSLQDIENHDPVCRYGHDLKTWQNVLTGKCDYQPVLTAERVISTLNDNDCPHLFLMIPVNLHSVGLREFYTLTYLKEGFSVHLLCEYPDCWHFLSSPGYRLTRPKEFVKKYGRRLQTLLRVLSKLEVPARLAGLVSETGANIADMFSSLDKLALDLDVHLTDFQESWSIFQNSNLDEDLRYLNSNDGLKRREFRKFLNKADEEQRFGDLVPTFIGSNAHWLCEDHHRLQIVPT